MWLPMNNGILRIEYVAVESWQFCGPEVEGIDLKGGLGAAESVEESFGNFDRLGARFSGRRFDIEQFSHETI
jgi:hypothetical protein